MYFRKSRSYNTGIDLHNLLKATVLLQNIDILNINL